MTEEVKRLNRSVTKSGEVLNKYRFINNKRTPIQVCLNESLPDVLGKAFLLHRATTEEVEGDNGEKLPRAVYEVLVVSKNATLKMGTPLTIKVKGQKAIVGEDYNTQVLLGTMQKKVIVFDDLMHWIMPSGEGLSASGARFIEMTPQEAVNL